MTLPSRHRPPLRSTFLRSFAIQGSWNYRTMIGGGFCFAILPVLRALYPDDADGALSRALKRHAEHFNAHPYLADVALGAAARLEADGADPDVIHRFKDAVRGPLGGLGDALVWAGWLPATLLVGLILAWLGLPPWIPVLAFLLLYNAGHLGLRVWGFRIGWETGRDVGRRLRAAGLARAAENIARVGTVLLGTFTGLVLTADSGLDASRWIWGGLAVAAFVVGVVGGQRVWRPAALSVVGAIAAITLIQLV